LRVCAAIPLPAKSSETDASAGFCRNDPNPEEGCRFVVTSRSS
jgi:hypothetical protein